MHWNGNPPPTLRQDLQVMEDEVISLQALIEDLFALSRAEVGRLTLRCEPNNVGELIYRIVKASRPTSARDRAKRSSMSAWRLITTSSITCKSWRSVGGGLPFQCMFRVAAGSQHPRLSRYPHLMDPAFCASAGRYYRLSDHHRRRSHPKAYRAGTYG